MLTSLLTNSLEMFEVLLCSYYQEYFPFLLYADYTFQCAYREVERFYICLVGQ